MASSACHNWVRIQIAVCQQTWVDDPFAADADVVFEGRQKRSARRARHELSKLEQITNGFEGKPIPLKLAIIDPKKLIYDAELAGRPR